MVRCLSEFHLLLPRVISWLQLRSVRVLTTGLLSMLLLFQGSTCWLEVFSGGGSSNIHTFGVLTLYTLDALLYPQKLPSLNFAPILPSGCASGPFDGSFHNTRSPNPRSFWENGLPLALCHGVGPSDPRVRAFSTVHVCSSNQGATA